MSWTLPEVTGVHDSLGHQYPAVGEGDSSFSAELGRSRGPANTARWVDGVSAGTGVTVRTPGVSSGVNSEDGGGGWFLMPVVSGGMGVASMARDLKLRNVSSLLRETDPVLPRLVCSVSASSSIIIHHQSSSSSNQS